MRVGETADRRPHVRKLPERVEVREERQEHDVGRPVADDLVGDGDVTRARIPDVRDLHGAEDPTTDAAAQSTVASPPSGPVPGAAPRR
jgi:hypothetical protein